MFSQACVKNSVPGGGMHGLGHAWQGCMCGGGGGMAGGCMAGACVVGVCMAGGSCMATGMHGGGHAWHAHLLPPILRDAVNQQAVCILLECILVFNENSIPRIIAELSQR